MNQYHSSTPESIQVMREEGIDVSKQIVRFFAEDMVKQADKIFVLTAREYCPPFLFNSPKAIFWDIEDPFGTPIENFNREIKRFIVTYIWAWNLVFRM